MEYDTSLTTSSIKFKCHKKFIANDTYLARKSDGVTEENEWLWQINEPVTVLRARRLPNYFFSLEMIRKKFLPFNDYTGSQEIVTKTQTGKNLE